MKKCVVGVEGECGVSLPSSISVNIEIFLVSNENVIFVDETVLWKVQDGKVVGSNFCLLSECTKFIRFEWSVVGVELLLSEIGDSPKGIRRWVVSF